MMDALFAKKEPKTGTDGTMSWTVDISNAGSGDDFVLGLKELVLPDGQRRPYSMWLSGVYPRALDGLCKVLSLDMRVIDPAWIGMKLRKLLNFGEPLGDFMARVPGSVKMESYPSTVSYVAKLIIHRYAMLGILDETRLPGAADGCAGDSEEDRSSRPESRHGRQDVQGMRQRHTDQERRLRILHELRRDRCVRVMLCGSIK